MPVRPSCSGASCSGCRLGFFERRAYIIIHLNGSSLLLLQSPFSPPTQLCRRDRKCDPLIDRGYAYAIYSQACSYRSRRRPRALSESKSNPMVSQSLLLVCREAGTRYDLPEEPFSIRYRRLGAAVIIPLLDPRAEAATLSPDPPLLDQFASKSLEDIEAHVSVVSADQTELAKINRDFGMAYRLRASPCATRSRTSSAWSEPSAVYHQRIGPAVSRSGHQAARRRTIWAPLPASAIR